jgi:hypothetical protein
MPLVWFAASDAKSFAVKFDLVIRGLGAIVFALPEAARFAHRLSSPALVM